MWTRTIFGVDSYHVIQWFLVYSILGWMVESTYMSICNRRLTNRGFMKGPMCPIYGFGALGVYFLLTPFDGNYVVLYILGAVIATLFEFLVAKLMLHLFGEVWWDYEDKPFNYKGILCLESTLAWGLYTVIMFMFLHRIVTFIVNSYSYEVGVFFGRLVILGFGIDFLTSMYAAKKDSLPRSFHAIRETILSYISR